MSDIKYMEVSTNKEFKGFKKVTAAVFDENVAIMAEDLYYRSPHRDKNIFFVAYDVKEEKYVGVLSLLHTPVQYEEVTLKAAEYAIAGTLEE